MTRPPITRSGAQHDAQHELSKAIYHQNPEPWPVRAVKYFSHLTNRILDHVSGHAPGGTTGSLLLALLIIVLVVVLPRRIGVPRRDARSGLVFTTEPPRSAAEHRQLAESAAAAQDWQTAVIERMRAVARELEERGVLEPRAGRTATELGREAGAAIPSAAPTLANAAATFNAVAYGDSPGSPADNATLQAADDAVRRAPRPLVTAR